ncbi:GNAT family protein [Halorubellus sp. PRR65]|uniref:GNAT family N-acetyltransferase n=1 Tax=Halorubellus sp. PRR65 TaxID=3098148 RepID=UPI002B25E799|nr:GNAT family protein [Halorubellus sp. PRR65]
MPGARVCDGERVTLRTLEEEDRAFVQRSRANPDIRYPLGNPLTSRTAMAAGDADDDGHDLLACLDGEDAGPGAVDEDDVERLGTVHVDDVAYKRPNLGFWLAGEYHGEGYGRESVALVVDWTFREYPTPAIGAEAFASNEASRALLESLGFEREGVRRDFMFVDGEHRDMVCYGLARGDWE